MTDLPSYFRNLGLTGEDDECIVCPHCHVEHFFSAKKLPPTHCDLCGQVIFKEPEFEPEDD